MVIIVQYVFETKATQILDSRIQILDSRLQILDSRIQILDSRLRNHTYIIKTKGRSRFCFIIFQRFLNFGFEDYKNNHCIFIKTSRIILSENFSNLVNLSNFE